MNEHKLKKKNNKKKHKENKINKQKQKQILVPELSQPPHEYHCERHIDNDNEKMSKVGIPYKNKNPTMQGGDRKGRGEEEEKTYESIAILAIVEVAKSPATRSRLTPNIKSVGSAIEHATIEQIAKQIQ